MPHDIATVLVLLAEMPGAFIADFAVVWVRCCVPAGVERIGFRFHLLMRNQIDRSIGVKIMIWAVGYATQTQIGTSIRHGRINGIGAHVVMPGAEVVNKCAAIITGVGAHDLPFGGEDKEHCMNGR